VLMLLFPCDAINSNKSELHPRRQSWRDACEQDARRSSN
jgi:hypothetical protein